MRTLLSSFATKYNYKYNDKIWYDRLTGSRGVATARRGQSFIQHSASTGTATGRSETDCIQLEVIILQQQKRYIYIYNTSLTITEKLLIMHRAVRHTIDGNESKIIQMAAKCVTNMATLDATVMAKWVLEMHTNALVSRLHRGLTICMPLITISESKSKS